MHLQVDVTNEFNFVSHTLMFQKLHVVKGDIVRLLYFVHSFNVFELWYFYNNEVIIILSVMGTHQGNFFHEPLFGLTHFWTLQFAKVQFPIWLFPTIVDDIHIIGPPSIGCINIEFIFLKFNYEIGLSIQHHKCELFCPHQAYLMISPFQLCLTPPPKTSNFGIFQWGLFCSLLLSSMMHYWKTLRM